MNGRMRPYLPELTIRDYNTYLWYLRGVRQQLALSYGKYSCRRLRHNGVLFALLADSLAGRPATCKNTRVRAPSLAADDVPDTGHPAGGAGRSAAGVASPAGCAVGRASVPEKVSADHGRHLPAGAYRKAVRENPALERIFIQELDQARVQRQLFTQNYKQASEPKSNLYAALYALLATDDDPNQRKSMH